ncbi:M48 family metallopeptidase [Undibacterium sp. SXout7W]|uniref:M48 family metallopeptidase n=1 Tax=Undibacterium sp. SXout7W TaxID=3413049 RepID=UPI003BF2BAC6
MDFFEQQDQAHRQSKKLLFLFFLAVLAIVIAVNVSLAVVWLWATGGFRAGVAHTYPHGFFFINTGVVLLFIAGGTLFEIVRLRDGGDVVAQMAGGRLVMPASADFHERRLLNIVEEMALASGIACPRVYIMDREEAINAFAAGYHQNEAVVAVTRGTLARLTRDELQGVVGHEFSHILNGDMCMNIKLIGILFGIQMIAGFGQELMYWSSQFGSSRGRNDKGPSIQLVMFVVGAILFVVGYVGIFFGRLIKSAVSRQREFLADASSVQFTRNPDGIGGALRKIGGLTRVNDCGSRIDHPRAEQLSHMFLGAARPNLLDGLFATHPPLEERLQRVYGHQVGFLDADEIIEPVAPEDMPPPGMYGFGARNVLAAQQARAAKGGSTVAGGVTTGAAVTGFGHHAMTADQSAVNTSAATLPSSVAVINGLGADITGNITSNIIENTAAGASFHRKAATPLNASLIQAAREPQSACALVYALLLDRSQSEPYVLQMNLLRQQAATLSGLAESLLSDIDRMQSRARLPLLDLAMPALRQLSASEKAQLLSLAHQLIAADQRMTQTEFVLQTVLERRLGMNAGRAVPVRYGSVAELKPQTCLLLSLVAHHHQDQAATSVAFERAALLLPDLALGAADLQAIDSVDFFDVRTALEKLNQLAPLAKPFLIKALLSAAARAPDIHIDDDCADLLRGICAAIDAPLPEPLTAVYATAHA